MVVKFCKIECDYKSHRESICGFVYKILVICVAALFLPGEGLPCQLEREGLAPRIAQGEIIRELGNGEGKRRTPFAEGLRESELFEVLREENGWLRRRVEELTPLALPRPRRRWLAWLLPAGGRSGYRVKATDATSGALSRSIQLFGAQIGLCQLVVFDPLS